MTLNILILAIMEISNSFQFKYKSIRTTGTDLKRELCKLRN